LFWIVQFLNVNWSLTRAHLGHRLQKRVKSELLYEVYRVTQECLFSHSDLNNYKCRTNDCNVVILRVVLYLYIVCFYSMKHIKLIKEPWLSRKDWYVDINMDLKTNYKLWLKLWVKVNHILAALWSFAPFFYLKHLTWEWLKSSQSFIPFSSSRNFTRELFSNTLTDKMGVKHKIIACFK